MENGIDRLDTIEFRSEEISTIQYRNPRKQKI